MYQPNFPSKKVSFSDTWFMIQLSFWVSQLVDSFLYYSDLAMILSSNSSILFNIINKYQELLWLARNINQMSNNPIFWRIVINDEMIKNLAVYQKCLLFSNVSQQYLLSSQNWSSKNTLRFFFLLRSTSD